MTTTYDPEHPAYLDEGDLRVELERVYDLCHGCRLCFNLCPSFPTLFDTIDARDGDVGAMTPAEQDQVVDECYQCKLCYLKCPYVPPHEWELDFPRLMMRAHAVRQSEGLPLKQRLTDQALARTDLLGTVSSAVAPLVNAATGTPGSWARRMMEKTVGMASGRLLPPYARQRFSSWFRRRPHHRHPGPGGRRRAPGGGQRLPHLLHRVHGARHRQGPGEGVRAQRRGLLVAGGHLVLRGPLAPPGQRPGVRQGGPTQRGRPGRRGPRRSGGGGGPAHLCLRGPEGLPDLPGPHPAGRRRRAGGRPHRRPRRVPDGVCTRGRAPPSTPSSRAGSGATFPTR